MNEKEVLKMVSDKMGAGSAMRLGDGAEQGEKADLAFSTGSIGLDLAIGIGGYPKGRVVELYGAEDQGQWKLALLAIAEAQKGREGKPGVAALVDLDHRFNPSSAANVGVDVARLLVSQPDFAEQAFDIVELLARSGAVDLVVVSTVGGLRSKAEFDGGHVEDGSLARAFGNALRKVTAVCYRTGTTVIFVNHLAPRLKAFEPSASGTNALKFYASVRIDVAKVVEGIRAKVAKNKCAAPFRDATIPFRAGRVDHALELFDLALARGFVAPGFGGEFAHVDSATKHETVFGRDRATAGEAINANASYFDLLKGLVFEHGANRCPPT